MGGVGKNISILILGVIALIIASYLMATVVESIVPEMLKAVGATGTDGLQGTILRFIPVGYAVGLLAIAFGTSVVVGFQSGGSATSRPANLIAAVIVLVIGISLVPVVDAGQDAAENSVTQFTAANATPANNGTFIGSIDVTTGMKCITATSGAARACASADAAVVGGQLAIAKTVVGYLTIGYVVALLVAAFGLANQASGGRLTGFARSRFNSGMGGM